MKFLFTDQRLQRRRVQKKPKWTLKPRLCRAIKRLPWLRECGRRSNSFKRNGEFPVKRVSWFAAVDAIEAIRPSLGRCALYGRFRMTCYAAGLRLGFKRERIYFSAGVGRLGQ